jgi:hypothetical protein
MKYASQKRQKARRIAAVERVKFRGEFKACWFCGSTWELCVDEIVAGMSDRSKGELQRECWTMACARCNTGKLATSSEPILILKLAMKWIYDRPYFDRVLCNTLRGRRPDAITMAQIIPTICRLLDGGAVE